MDYLTQAEKLLIPTIHADCIRLGGYPAYMVCDDNGILCSDCVQKHLHQIVHSTRNKHCDGWQCIGSNVNYEDPALYCDNCTKRIKRAYPKDKFWFKHREKLHELACNHADDYGNSNWLEWFFSNEARHAK